MRNLHNTYWCLHWIGDSLELYMNILLLLDKLSPITMTSPGLRESVACNYNWPRCSRWHSDVLCACWYWQSHWFLIWSSWVLTRVSSHIQGRLYLPMILLRVEMCTLMYLDPFIVLASFASHCPQCSICNMYFI